MSEKIKGFSKLSKTGKIQWLANNHFDKPEQAIKLLEQYWNEDSAVQKLHDEFSENTVSNFYMPFGIAPNFLINGKVYAVPMAIEESSVVAASAKSASFWMERGGFKAEVISMKKIGHVHFVYTGAEEKLFSFFERNKDKFYKDTESITKNMRMRGGGVLDIILKNKSEIEEGYYQLEANFDTRDSMGANFVNSCLEQFSQTLEREISLDSSFSDEEKNVQIIMSILSNYTPECVVRSEVSCTTEELVEGSGISSEEFVEKFSRAVHIAEHEPYRATTHNKGIMNGVDAVVIATGNDFRAVEAGAHTYATKDGKYSSLSHVELKDGIFRFWIEMPLSLGTVGGLTSLHPLVKFSHELLGNPDAEELMMIAATVGLAQNFGALRSLTTTGIQKGHMKMHLLNILNQLEATEEEKRYFVDYFRTRTATHSAVVEEFHRLRGIPMPEKVDVNKR
ncbi:MAG: hydroxymethylglutaryl-CoA reductase, degradative [Flavobacteriales bacterium]|nr:hydroxymethylglutaryl-CoA reductase, degradative [Flavobacteriales bacterium]